MDQTCDVKMDGFDKVVIKEEEPEYEPICVSPPALLKPDLRVACEFCDNSYCDNSYYYKHANKEHVEEISVSWFLCAPCNFYYPSKAGLKAHTKHIHVNQEKASVKNKCPFCPSTYSSFKNVYLHARKAHPKEVAKEWIQCPSCDISFPSQEILSYHCAASHTQASVDRFKCQFCPQSFLKPQQFYRHANASHLDEVTSIWQLCVLCESYFPTMSALKMHRLKGHPESGLMSGSRFPCTFCTQSFATRHVYYKHANRDHFEVVSKAWFSCQGCHELFPSEDVLKKHSDQAHYTKTEDRLSCYYCNENFSKKHSYYRHANKKHFQAITVDWFICEFCNTYLPDEDVLSMHQQKAHSNQVQPIESFNCQFCPNVYPVRRMYVRHARQCHKSEVESSWLTCDKCPEFFPTLRSLEAHNVKVHPKPIETKNDINRKITTESVPEPSGSDIANKEETVHEPDLDEVEEELNNSSTMSGAEDNGDESRIPSSKVKLRCTFCPTTFRYSHLYLTHARLKHFTEISKSWKPCHNCCEYFPTKRSMEAHNTRIHLKNQTPQGSESQEPATEVKEEEDFSPEEKVKVVGKIPHRVFCHFCDKSFCHSHMYFKHARMEHLDRIVEDWILCQLCNDYFPSAASLKAHATRVHHKNNKDSSDVTKDSSDVTKDFSDVFVEPKTTGRKKQKKMSKIKCAYCPSKFEETSPYYKHANSNHLQLLNRNWLFCSPCGSYWPTRNVLEVHKRAMHENTLSTVDPSKKIKCSFCDQGFHKPKEYYQHANSEHGDLVCDEWKICQICPLYFPSVAILKIHTDATHKSRNVSTFCQFCNKKFYSKIRYFRHANADHSMEVASEWIECNVCNEYYPSISDLKKHTRQEHNHDKLLSRMILDPSDDVHDENQGDDEVEFDMDTLDENASLEPSITIDEEVSADEFAA